ncbi:conserved protein of unknown function [Nitrospira japonica]|uniref:AAA+ ATPase domain-containing protein n=1 Tax=Nitrospira japonica TaxID=1325564 RepID=A0A1W1I313_9BACT|nr:AAA family ATPase [Nitrospira japonica]SLM47397.1 conserved protein of unknown function [Nitrospira japonica]
MKPCSTSPTDCSNLMTSAEVKTAVAVQMILRAYGSAPDEKGKWNCLFPERHKNGDLHHSVTVKGDIATCWSQKCFEQADIFRLVALKEGIQTFADQKKRVIELAGLSKRNGTRLGKIVATYDYTDERGTLLFQVLRYHPKTFRQRRPVGQSDWLWNVNDTRLVLYRLPLVLKADYVLIVEGEKDVERAYELGLPAGWAATCNPMGAEKWNDGYSEALSGKRVVILPDADEPGRKHGAKIAHSLTGIATSVEWISLPTNAKDFSEWAVEKTERDVAGLLSKIVPQPQTFGLQFTSLAELLTEPDELTTWLVEQRLVVGGLSLLCGKPKAGKSTLARNLALSVSRGTPWLGMETVQGLVFYLALEEKRSQIRKHFQLMGATGAEAVHIFCAPSPANGLTQLRAATERDKPVLIIVDPLFRFTRVRDCNDYASVTSALEPLLVLARESNAHVLAVHHLGKGNRDGGDAILGSTAIFAAVDAALILKRTEKYRTLSSIQRYGEDLEEVTLSMEGENGLISIGPLRKDAEEVAIATLILDFLATQGKPVEESVIHDNIWSRKAIKVKALRRLVEDRKVLRQGAGKKGNPFIYSNAGFLVPSIYREPETWKGELIESLSNSKGNASSHLLAGSGTASKYSESEAEVIDLC